MILIFWILLFFISVTPIIGRTHSILVFDGSAWSVYSGEHIVLKVPVAAGRPFFQSPKNQFLKNKGPLPEGTYSLKLNDTVQFRQPGTVSTLKWILKYIAWGNLAIPLEPSGTTDLKGRHSFMIHGGGWIVGSKGCVVVYGKDRELYQLLTKNAQDVELVVRYNP
jgi:hypothetical protein